MSSYNAIVSTVLHFETYRNIDLLHQGLYFLRASLISEDGKGIGLPVDIYASTQVSRAKKNKIDYHNILPASIDETSFNTKTFTIRYCEEEIELNDICEFRLDIPVRDKYLATNYVLEVQLHFGEITKIGGVEKLPQYVQNIKESVEFKMVASQKFVVREIATGISQYVRVQNDGSYYGMCNLTVHSTIIDFRYRIVSPEAALAMRKGKPEIKVPARPAVQKSFHEFLFGNSDGSVPKNINPSEADKIYSDYVNVLAKAHENVKERFLEVQHRCLDEDQKKKNCALLMYQELIFPGDDNESEMFSLKEDLLGNSELADESKHEALLKEDEDPRSRPDVPEDNSECNITNEPSQIENYRRLDPELRVEEKKEKLLKFQEDNFAGAGDMDERTNNNIVVPTFKYNQRSTIKGGMMGPHPKYSLKLAVHDPRKLAAKFAYNITLISGQVIELWQRYIELITITPRFVTEMLAFEYLKVATTQK
eukprot:TRINITY_DN3208_c0_g4_i1.p1 TRINITY_DN3208_c0_g4~~TRINITY_DN3208_c0_g4_i1.p1  ORF type:complete len:507 (+),score=144.06 TRINITY_DN3208_c0_g4_i1:82-1521(+)